MLSAMADIMESIDELRYYRSAIMVPDPGPDSDTARAKSDETIKTSAKSRIMPS